MPGDPGRWAWVDVDLGVIAHNVATLAALVAPAELWCVVKADGYGHGAPEVARTALAHGARGLAVALVSEGEQLRDAGIDGPILVLSEPPSLELERVAAARLEPAVYHLETVAAAAAAGVRTVHLKIDTGMHRVGATPDEAVDLTTVIHRAGLELGSVWTHLACADDPTHPATAAQLAVFAEVCKSLAAAGVRAPVHVANSAGALAWPAARLDRVRVGISTYGLVPGPALLPQMGSLRPALSLRARVTHVQRLAAGQGVSYGHRFHTARPTTVATLPLGYADGVPRRWHEAGTVLLGSKHRRIAGVVTMDQLMVDCGDDHVAIGDEAVLLGEQGGERITADDWAVALGTINYEVVCGLSARLPRHYRAA